MDDQTRTCKPWCINTHDFENDYCSSATVEAGPGLEVSLTYHPSSGTHVVIGGAINGEVHVADAPQLAYALLMAHAMHSSEVGQ